MDAQNRKKFARDIASLIGGQGVITIVALATSVVMANALGVEGRGFFAMAMLFAGLLATFSDFGLSVAGTKFTASKKWPAETVFASNLVIVVIRLFALLLIGTGIIHWSGSTLFRGMPDDLQPELIRSNLLR